MISFQQLALLGFGVVAAYVLLTEPKPQPQPQPQWHGFGGSAYSPTNPKGHRIGFGGSSYGPMGLDKSGWQKIG